MECILSMWEIFQEMPMNLFSVHLRGSIKKGYDFHNNFYQIHNIVNICLTKLNLLVGLETI